MLENPWVVSGRFTDAKTGAGVPDVDVKVSPGVYNRGHYADDDTHTTTDKDGNYKLLIGSADFFPIQVRAPLGYPGINTSLDSSTLEKLAGKGRKVKYNVKLQPGVILPAHHRRRYGRAGRRRRCDLSPGKRTQAGHQWRVRIGKDRRRWQLRRNGRSRKRLSASRCTGPWLLSAIGQ